MKTEERKKKEAARKRAWAEANREKHLAQRKVWAESNREKVLAQKKAWREANREKIAAYSRAHYGANVDKIKAYRTAWERINQYKRRAIKARRRASKMQATPKWITKADFAAIEEWYQLAKDLQWLSEEKLHVDHIIPLQGKNVCGLHIASNLQILPASENIRKGNRLGHK